MSLVELFLGSPVAIGIVMYVLIACGALLFITRSLKFDAKQYQRLGDKPPSDSNDDDYSVSPR